MSTGKKLMKRFLESIFLLSLSRGTKDQTWEDAKRQYSISATTTQMAKELGLNPHKLGKIVIIGKSLGRSLCLTLFEHFMRKDFKSEGIS